MLKNSYRRLTVELVSYNTHKHSLRVANSVDEKYKMQANCYVLNNSTQKVLENNFKISNLEKIQNVKEI